jgi:hypothetical protein
VKDPGEYIGLEVDSERYGSGVVTGAADDGTLVVSLDCGAELWTDTAAFEEGL